MVLYSWNVNGIRSVSQKGFLPWFEAAGADIVCLQEVKAGREVVPEELINPRRYFSHFACAKKKGYSGVAVYSKKEPLEVALSGISEIDDEGRVLIAKYPAFTLVNAYFPNSQRTHNRLPYKLYFCGVLKEILEKRKEKGENVVVCGDFNIAHKEIDLKNPKENKMNAGFLPEERSWMDTFVGGGFVDLFRNFEKGEGHYTWWSYRPTIRERNIGWRLDYFFCNQDFQERAKRMEHLTGVMGSDHCPIRLQIR